MGSDGRHDHERPDQGQGRHDHGHDNVYIDWDTMGPLLERSAELNTPFFEQAAWWLRDLVAQAQIRRVVDVGSGPGVACVLLAKVFPQAHVLAMDGATPLLDRARARADREGVGDRVHTHLAELPGGLDTLDGLDAGDGVAGGFGQADLIWTSHVLHHLGDQHDAVARLHRRLRPGGLLAVAEGGLPTRYLPRDIGFGRPSLQTRLEAAWAEWFTDMRAALPGATATVEDWAGMLTTNGLRRAGTRTFLVDHPAPVGPAVREHLFAHLSRLRDTIGGSLDADDLATLQRLLDRDDDAGVLRRPDVFMLGAHTVYAGYAAVRT